MHPVTPSPFLLRTATVHMLLSWLITHRYLALAALCLALYASGNGRTPLWDRDEPRYCQATREMLVTGDYIVPRFNGQERFNKPILIYWLMCGSRRGFAGGEFGGPLRTAFV